MAIELITEPLPNVVASSSFTPRLLAILSTALAWRQSMLLREAFQLGNNDWRVISALATKPGSSATEVTEFLSMNKAVVSKAVNTLIDRDLVASREGPRGSRLLFLTRGGAQMHDQMLPIALECEGIILGNLSPKEVRQLHALLDKLMAQLPELSSVAIPE